MLVFQVSFWVNGVPVKIYVPHTSQTLLEGELRTWLSHDAKEVAVTSDWGGQPLDAEVKQRDTRAPKLPDPNFE